MLVVRATERRLLMDNFRRLFYTSEDDVMKNAVELPSGNVPVFAKGIYLPINGRKSGSDELIILFRYSTNKTTTTNTSIHRVELINGNSVDNQRVYDNERYIAIYPQYASHKDDSNRYVIPWWRICTNTAIPTTQLFRYTSNNSQMGSPLYPTKYDTDYTEYVYIDFLKIMYDGTYLDVVNSSSQTKTATEVKIMLYGTIDTPIYYVPA